MLRSVAVQSDAVITKAGFFHFGSHHDSPIPELKEALSRKRNELPDSLIVLPEGFNIGKPYKCRGKCDTNAGIISNLHTLASVFGVSFVAGLIVDEGSGSTPPYNSAYLINSYYHEPICHKMFGDGWHKGGSMNEENYSRCTNGFDLHNPSRYDGVSIAALVCADASPDPSRAPREFLRRETVLSLLAKASTPWKILCIPACVSQHFSRGAMGGVIDLSWHQQSMVIVLANSDPHDVGSFITNETGRIVASVADRLINEVVVVPLAELKK